MALIVTSDTHFNHNGIIKYCSETRPYENHLEMNAAIQTIWNENVRPNDDVWVLGDFGFNTKDGDDLESIFRNLNGHKFLCKGNHDERNKKVLSLPWEKIIDLGTLKENKQHAIICHYALESWKNAHHGYFHLHGHAHGTMTRRRNKRWDVGWDVFGKPMPFEYFAEAAKLEEYDPVDHHGGL